MARRLRANARVQAAKDNLQPVLEYVGLIIGHVDPARKIVDASEEISFDLFEDLGGQGARFGR